MYRVSDTSLNEIEPPADYADGKPEEQNKAAGIDFNQELLTSEHLMTLTNFLITVIKNLGLVNSFWL